MKMNELLKQIREFRKKLLEMIDQMPDAQTGVNQISKNPPIAIVKLSHIQKNKMNLSPSYYLNCESKEALKNMIKLTKIENLPERIDEILKSGKIFVRRGYTITLNPEFVSFLKEMWDGALSVIGEFKFTRYNEFESKGLVNCMVSFVPAVTIDCKPPFITGVKTSTWIKFRPGKEPQSKEELETCLGISILSWE